MERGNLIVFMGEAARRQYIRRAALDRGFVDAEDVTTFARLRAACGAAARRAGLLDRPEADGVSRAMLHLAAAGEAAAEFAGQGVLGRASASALAEALESMIHTLAPFGDTAEAIHAWLLRRPAGSKDRQLGQLYAIYRRRLQDSKWADTRDINAAVLRLLRGPLAAWPPVLSAPDRALHFRALTWLDPFAEQFIGVLGDRLGAPRVLLSSTLPPAHAERMEDRLAAQIRTEVLAGLEQETWSAWTEGLGDAMAVEDAQLAADSRDRLSFVRSAGLQGEVEDLARRIRRERDENGVPAERIALVVRQPDEYLDTVVRVFHEFRIPFFCRQGRPVSASAPVRVLLALLQFPSDPTRERLCALLQSPALAWPGLGTLEARQEAAHLIESSGIGPVLQPEDWRAPGRVPESLRAPVASILSSLGLWQPAAREWPLREHARRALDLTEQLGLAPSPVAPEFDDGRHALDKAIELLRRLEEDHGSAAPLARSGFLDLFTRLLAEPAMLPGSSAEYGVWVVSPADMAGLTFDVVLIAGLNEGSFPAITREDAVFSDEERAALRRALERQGVKLPQWGLPLLSIRSAQERVLFLACLGAARERLVLSCRTTDGDGRQLNPGDFFRSLWALAGDPEGGLAEPGESWRSTLPLPLCRTPAEARRRLGRLVEDSAAAAEPERALLQALPAATGDGRPLAHAIRVEHAREAFFNRRGTGHAEAGPYCGKIDRPSVRQQVESWLAARGALSPTALETLARCRYRFFLGTVCRLGPARLQEDAPDAMDRGRVIHNVLEQIYRGLRGDEGQPEVLSDADRAEFADLRAVRAWAVEEKPGAWRLRRQPGPSGVRSLPLVTLAAGPEERYRAYAHRVAAAACARAEKEDYLLGDPGVWETEKPKIARIAGNYLSIDFEQSAAERRYPALFELAFGGKDRPELRLGPEDRGVRVRGRVDRVDLIFDEAGRLAWLLVADYKGTGRGGLSPEKYAEEIAENLDCQLPVYGFAAQQALFGRYNEPELNAMTEAVYHIQDRDRKEVKKQFQEAKRVRLADGEAGSVTALFIERLMKNLARLRAADFSVDPLDCDYCDFSHVCRVDVTALKSAANAAEG